MEPFNNGILKIPFNSEYNRTSSTSSSSLLSTAISERKQNKAESFFTDFIVNKHFALEYPLNEETDESIVSCVFKYRTEKDAPNFHLLKHSNIKLSLFALE